jgi:uncharacterized protein (UPF0335 family)
MGGGSRPLKVSEEGFSVRAIKKRLTKLERARGERDPLIIILDKYEDSLTSEERAALDVYQERMTQGAKKGGLAVILRSRKKAQELLALADKKQVGKEHEGP